MSIESVSFLQNDNITKIPVYLTIHFSWLHTENKNNKTKLLALPHCNSVTLVIASLAAFSVLVAPPRIRHISCPLIASHMAHWNLLLPGKTMTKPVDTIQTLILYVAFDSLDHPLLESSFPLTSLTTFQMVFFPYWLFLSLLPKDLLSPSPP